MSYGYFLGLFLSIAIYQTVFHRLTEVGFPGPWYARITKIWHVWAFRDSRNHAVGSITRDMIGASNSNHINN